MSIDGPAEKKHIFYKAKKSNQAGELDFTYYNAVYTVENALAKVKDEKGMKRVEKFLKEEICPDCSGTRLSEAARAPKLRGISLDEACRMTLARAGGVGSRRAGVSCRKKCGLWRKASANLFQTAAKRLMDLGLVVSFPGSCGFHSFHRRAAADAAGEGGAEPDDGRSLCAGRAVHRPASFQY